MPRMPALPPLVVVGGELNFIFERMLLPISFHYDPANIFFNRTPAPSPFIKISQALLNLRVTKERTCKTMELFLFLH